MKPIKLTTMCLIRKGDEILVLDRIKNDWPGITFPGGKVEDDEDIVESCIREIKEETNLDIMNPINKGYFEWNTIEEGVRHLSILFETTEFNGEIKSSSEGNVFFIKEKDIINYNLSNDILKILDVINKKE